MNNLPNFARGTIENPGIGFRLIENYDLPRYFRDDFDYEDFLNKLLIIEYQLEIHKLIHLNGEDKPTLIKDYIGYIFFISPNLLIIKGNKEDCKTILDSFFAVTRFIFQRIEVFSFESDFFIKLIEKLWFKQFKFEDDFRISYLMKLKTLTNEGITRVIAYIDNPFPRFLSRHAAQAILNNYQFEYCKYRLILKDVYFTIELDRKGPVNIMQDCGDFVWFSKNERAIHGSYIIYRLVNYFNYWKNLPPNSKNISEKFKNSLREYLDALEDE